MLVSKVQKYYYVSYFFNSFSFTTKLAKFIENQAKTCDFNIFLISSNATPISPKRRNVQLGFTLDTANARDICGSPAPQYPFARRIRRGSWLQKSTPLSESTLVKGGWNSTPIRKRSILLRFDENL